MSVKRINLTARKIRAACGSDEGQQAFTIVELLLVMIISLIIMAGMVALISSVFTVFRTSRDLQALNDSSRRALDIMSRQLRTALHFNSSICDVDNVTFWGDIDGDQDLPGSTAPTPTDVNNYTPAEMVQLRQRGSTVVADVTQPGKIPPTPDPPITVGSFVGNLNFYYFAKDVVPGGTDPTDPDGNFNPSVDKVNDKAAMIRIVLRLRKGKVHHSYYGDVFLRIVLRQS